MSALTVVFQTKKRALGMQESEVSAARSAELRIRSPRSHGVAPREERREDPTCDGKGPHGGRLDGGDSHKAAFEELRLHVSYDARHPRPRELEWA